MSHEKVCTKLPPGFSYHIIKGNAPAIYNWFWGVGGLCWLTVLAVMLPHMHKLRKDGEAFRDQNKDMFIAKGFQIGYQICSYPVVLATCKLATLLFPSFMFSFNFISACYEVYSIYLFTQFLIMLMGGHKKSAFLLSLSQDDPTKYWSSFPLACCFRRLEKAKHMSHTDFLIVYGLILQFCITAPFWSFIMLLKDTRGDKEDYHWANWCNTICAVGCIYGLFVLMRGTMNVLNPYNPRGKFFTIQSLFLATIMPSDILTYFNISTAQKNHRYDDSVMREAWACVITLIFCALLSFFYRLFWSNSDCRSAQISFENGTVISVPPSFSYSGYKNLQELHDGPNWDDTESSQRNNSLSFQVTTGNGDKNGRSLKL